MLCPCTLSSYIAFDLFYAEPVRYDQLGSGMDMLSCILGGLGVFRSLDVHGARFDLDQFINQVKSQLVDEGFLCSLRNCTSAIHAHPISVHIYGGFPRPS